MGASSRPGTAMVVSPFWHQLPAHSPLTGRALLKAFYSSVSSGHPHSRLSQFLRVSYSADYVALTDSATSALQLAIRVARSCLQDYDAGSNDIVALPAFTCYEVCAAAIGADVRIVLYDVDRETLAPDPTSLERALAAGARVVVATPLFGLPFDWSHVAGQVERHGAMLIEDAAQGHGATWQGRPLGSLGQISVLSFGRGKGWTGGGGGALLLRGKAAQSWGGRTFTLPSGGSFETIGYALAQFALGRPAVYGIPLRIPALKLGRTEYRPPGSPRRMSSAATALVIGTCNDAVREARTRREIAATWRDGLTINGALRPIDAPAGGAAGFLRFPVRAIGAGPRVRELLDRGRRLGIAQSYPTTLAQIPALRTRMIEPSIRTPGADSLVRELVTLPTHSLLSAEDRRAILSLCRSFNISGGSARAPVIPDGAAREVVSASGSGT